MVLIAEILGVSSLLPYGLLLVRSTVPREPGSTGLLPADFAKPGVEYK